jgi:2-polyprenyl-3-methyl-5-hydroxy-6-metoxy-1,4-benzoquinol methylase
MASGTQAGRVERLFTDRARVWDALYDGRQGPVARLVDRHFRRDIYERYALTFAELSADLPSSTILDVGCGTGVYCVEALRRGAAKVTGIDVSRQMIAHARARAAANGCEGKTEFLCSEFPSGSLTGRHFNFAIVMGVMDYVGDPRPFLAELRRLVTGRAVLSFPGRHWFREPLRRYRYKLLRRCAVYGYGESEIHSLCLDAGFERATIRRLDHSGICYIVTAHPSAQNG